MKNITLEMREQLRKPLPQEAISQHPTKKFLSSIKAIYVVERLNDVFGVGEWNIKNEVIEKDGKWVIVKSTFTVNGYSINIEQFGGNDNADPGDAYKGAATDALTKIGSYLEIGIDVFKGIKDDKPKIEQSEDNRPWLSDSLLNKALERIKKGEFEVKENTIKAFRMKKEQREKIMSA